MIDDERDAWDDILGERNGEVVVDIKIDPDKRSEENIMIGDKTTERNKYGIINRYDEEGWGIKLMMEKNI
jgi:hypothetical protein